MREPKYQSDVCLFCSRDIGDYKSKIQEASMYPNLSLILPLVPHDPQMYEPLSQDIFED